MTIMVLQAYLEACFREALRLHPAVGTVTRDVAVDTTLKGELWNWGVMLALLHVCLTEACGAVKLRFNAGIPAALSLQATCTEQVGPLDCIRQRCPPCGMARAEHLAQW